MGPIQRMLEELSQLALSAQEDAGKCEGGNKQAGTRVRGAMQDVKAKAQAIRQAVLEQRAAKKG